ncbi:MAG: class I SAM-dependent methyltransferase [Boseongicola sp.]|nr:class I SAM-dependent methyltransferase [Boseongicola sp.]MDD9976134.1 class I SAM-dependent methyltransferase [Boseongicola sp.]
MYEEFRAKERSGWGSKADYYEHHTARITTQAIPTLLAAVRVRAGASVLDICTGPGYAAGAAHAICARATGVDFAPEMVARAAQNFPDCTFEEGDALALRFSDGTFDAAVCTFGIFHVTDPAQAIAEAYRVLKPGCRYAFSQWCAPNEAEFFRIGASLIAEHADMSLVPPAPNAFDMSDRSHCEQVMKSAGFDEIIITEVPSVYHAPEGELFDGIMKLSVRGAMIVEAQDDATRQRIRDVVNAAAKSHHTDEGVIIPSPCFVVSGRKPEKR